MFILVFVLFRGNRRFRKKCEKTSIFESFSEAKTMRNRENMVLKNVYFFKIIKVRLI